MSDSTSPGANTVNSDSTDTISTMQTPQTLRAVPAELLGIVAEMLDVEDIVAMRATCRELRDGAAFEFCERVFRLVKISGTQNGVLNLLAVLASATLPRAHQAVRTLYVDVPLLQSPEAHDESNDTDVARLLRTMPNLTTVGLFANMNADEHIDEVKFVPVFLTCLAQLPSRVRHLDICSVKPDVDLLVNVLEAHSKDLRIFRLYEVTLDSQLAWLQVFEVLRSTRIRHLDLEYLQFRADEGKIEQIDFEKYPVHGYWVKQKVLGEGEVSCYHLRASRGCVQSALEFLLQ
jgi:hypothetical protein